jgi:hypothetical protein
MKKRLQFGLASLLLLIAVISIPLAGFRRKLDHRADQAAELVKQLRPEVEVFLWTPEAGMVFLLE